MTGCADGDARVAAAIGDTAALNTRPRPPVFSTMFLAACLGLTIIGLIVPVAGLFARVSIDYGEGFNAYWAAAAMQGRAALYSPAHVLIANNYPPLSFYLIGALGRAIGDNIFAGRLVALAAMFATAMLSGYAVFLLGAARRWAWITGLLLLASAELLFGHFVAIDNPQWLAQALMLGSTIPLIRRAAGPAARDCLVSAAAVVLAILVKHNVVALPLASGVWLAARHRRALLHWILCIAALAGLAAAALHALYGNVIVVEILTFDRTVEWQNFRAGLVKSACFIPMLLVAAVAIRPRGDDRWLLFALAGVLGVAAGIGQRLGAGVYTNAHFEALVALTIVTGHAFGAPGVHWRWRFAAPAWQAALLVAVLVPGVIPLPRHIGEWAEQLAARRRTQADWGLTIADVGAARGPVLCEIPAICYWAGKPLLVDFFAFGQKLRMGHDPLQLPEWIAARRMRAIIVENSYLQEARAPRLPPPYPALIDREYRSIRIIQPGAINEMVPRDRPLPVKATPRPAAGAAR